jgi:hypothetical protein
MFEKYLHFCEGGWQVRRWTNFGPPGVAFGPTTYCTGGTPPYIGPRTSRETPDDELPCPSKHFRLAGPAAEGP